MSTKTSLLKRIAQSAVLALVGGLLSMVATPAANAANPTSISATCVARAGVGGFINVAYDGDGVGLLKAKQTARVLAGGGTYTLQTNLLGGNAAYTIDSASTSASFQLMADTITTGISSVTYLVWIDYAAGKAAGTASDATPDDTNDITTSVTCNVAGAPASFTLSAASASIGSNETATFTVTPKDASGYTTLLAKGSGATAESITVTGSQASTGTAVLQIMNGVDTSTARDKTTFATGRSIGQKATSAEQYLSTAQVLASYASGVSTQASETGTWNASYETGTMRTSTGTGATVATRPKVTLDYRDTDASAQFIPAVSVAGRNAATAESVTTNGAFTVNVSATDAATATFTIAGAGDIAGATASTFTLTTGTAGYGATQGHSFGSNTAVSATAAGLGLRTAAYGAVAGLTTPTTYGSKSVGTTTYTTTSSTARSISYVASTVTGKTINLKLHSGTDAATIAVTVAARTGVTVPTGITAGTLNYTTVGDGTETSVVIALAATAPLSGQGYSVSWKNSAIQTTTLNFTYEAPIVDSTRGSVDQVPTGIATAKNVTGGTNTLELTVRDQFYDLVSGATVLMTITGRNAVTSSAKTTDALGKAAYTWTDSGAVLTGSGATGTTDVVTITAQTSNATSAKATSPTTTTITYSATLAANTITVTNDGAADGVAAGSCAAFTATVLDASGLGLSGYPVTFTGNANSYFSSVANTSTYFTSAAGVATANFCGKLVGTATVTVASGGKSGTSSFTVISGTHRTIAVDAATATMAPGESKRVTVTVKDAFGNVDPDVAVTIAYTGTAGRVASVNGVSSSTCTTNASGQCVIELAADSAGTGTLTLTMTGGNTSTAATLGDGSATPARVATVSTAVTISGKNATTIAVEAAQAAADAATDAALEAIDAANAATDAANLSAEAADAATVAAEEARDAADAATAAVEALATEVATLMAALKAQITTLANTVAKIAKKVKA